MAQGKKATVGQLALVAALAATAPSYAQTAAAQKPSGTPAGATGPVNPIKTPVGSGGNIDPFGPPKAPTVSGGNIDSFYEERPFSPSGGNLDPFAGGIDPFAGGIDPFAGGIDPFGGNVDPFGGQIDPFGGNVDPFGGNVDPFAGRTDISSKSLGAHWKAFGTTWQEVTNRWKLLDASPTDANARTALVQQLNLAADESQKFWGAKVQEKSGKNVRDAVINPLLAKYGVSLADPASFAKLNKSQRTKLVYEWYDTLQTYAGIDHVDRWMSQVNWNPNLTKVQGSGSDSIIGLLDTRITSDIDLRDNIVKSTGYNGTSSQHGAAVLSLIVADHDGKGVQGIAPRAKVYVHNPFDATNTASVADLARGINKLLDAKASIINLSLGVKGSILNNDWKMVFSDATIASRMNSAVYVIAAGNDGITQTTNVDWTGAPAVAAIFVGSVDAKNNISSFSNRPGYSCISGGANCAGGTWLASRFMVAPGELMLVSDGNNGITRMSGTSFSAPLVSGAISLLHDRWPWLAKHPHVSAEIILSTAKDLGAPGIDPVYGRGLLDVEASQAPIDFKALRYYEYSSSTATPVERNVNYVAAQMKADAWSTTGAFYSAYEQLSGTYRDFLIPMSTRLIGQQTSVNGTNEYFQDYVTKRMDDWVDAGAGFTDAHQLSLKTSSGLKLGFNVLPAETSSLDRRAISRMPSPNVRLSSENGRFGFSLGQGNGLRMLAGNEGLGLSSDYDASNGGVNPILGLASGGSFMNADVAIDDATSIAVGFTQNRTSIEKNASLTSAQRSQLRDVDDYRANAFNVRIAHKLGKGATLTADFANVREGNGLLGVQSIERSDFRNGTASQTATVGASFKMPGNVMLAASATGAVTKSKGDQALTTTGKGVLSSAFAVAVTKQGILGKNDGLRLSVSQALHVESGKLAFTSMSVVNRATGELGQTTQTFDISKNARRLTGEMIYATPLLKTGELSFFGRSDYRINAADGKKVDGLVIGGRVSLPF